ncbi:MAG: diguanylate cyclase domain-containing protein, partial [Nitrospiraceae bacterium]
FGPRSSQSRKYQPLRLATRAQATETVEALEDLLFQLEVKKLTMEDNDQKDSTRVSENDPLTGVRGRRVFERFMAHELGRSQRFGHTFTLALFTITEWSSVLAKGIALADQIVVTFTCACKASLRGYDQICRIEDSEFAVMLPQSDRWDADAVCRRITERFDRALRQQSMAVQANVEVGLATFPFDGESHTALLDIARARRSFL